MILNQGKLTSETLDLRVSAKGEASVHIAMVGRPGDTGFTDEENSPMDSRHLKHRLPAFLDRGGCLEKTKLHLTLVHLVSSVVLVLNYLTYIQVCL